VAVTRVAAAAAVDAAVVAAVAAAIGGSFRTARAQSVSHN
jgi:hypothetical protein